ncbi:fibronectin type III domain-containing protein [Candidatus Dojkabacteria bacterium]|nr:fibronectin type III domain-containing protein [Candidatus Dojkabacteria bacterium]
MSEDESFPQKKQQRKFRTLIIILFIAVILIPLSVSGVMYITEMRTKALPTEVPQNVVVTNITDTSATISWVTPTVETIGFVKFGNQPEVSQIAFDIRDIGEANGQYTLHYVDLVGLNPDSSYYYLIAVGGKEYKMSQNQLYQFRTGSTLETVQMPQPVKGEVEDSSGSNEDLIVYLYAEKDGLVSNELSALTLDRRYTFDLSNLRLADLSDYFTEYNSATLYIVAEGGDRGEGRVTTQIIQINE